MDILDTWDYPVSSFLRLLTPLYTEREKNCVYYFTGDCGEEDRAYRGDWETGGRSEMTM